MTLCPCLQVRRAIQQMLFQGKDFSWIRHVTIAVVLLTFINLLVIFAPSILGIFGMIGVWPPLALGVTGSTTAPAWCSALPDLPVPRFPLFNVPEQRGMWDVPQPHPCPSRQVSVVQCWLLAALLASTCSSPECSPWTPNPGSPCLAPSSVPRPLLCGDSARTQRSWVPGKLCQGWGWQGGEDLPGSWAGRAELLHPCLLQVPPLLPASSSSSLPSSTSASCPRTRSHCAPPQKSW